MLNSFKIYGTISIFILLSGAITYVSHLRGSADKLNRENSSLQKIVQDTLRIERTKNGNKIATESSIEVSKSTFENLQGTEIRNLEKDFAQPFERVQEKTDINLQTITKLKAVVKDTTVRIPGNDSLRKAKVVHFRSTWKNEEVVIVGDSAYSTDTSTLRIVRMQVLGKRTKKFLFVRYGPRKKEYKTLIFNPNTGIVSLKNMSVIQ